jgi:hypothetical protein
MMRLGLTAALESCPASVVPVILRRLSDGELDTEPTVLALRVLAISKTRTALDHLLGIAVRKRRFWGMSLAPKSPEVLAALSGLAQHWPQDSKVKGAIALAAKSHDPEVRAAIELPEKRR